MLTTQISSEYQKGNITQDDVRVLCARLGLEQEEQKMSIADQIINGTYGKKNANSGIAESIINGTFEEQRRKKEEEKKDEKNK